MKQKLDFMGNELCVGNAVIFSNNLKTDLHEGIIVKETKKLVYIQTVYYGFHSQRYPDKVLKINK